MQQHNKQHANNTNTITPIPPALINKILPPNTIAPPETINRKSRHILALQATPATTREPLTPSIVATVTGLLPATFNLPDDPPDVKYDNRAWLSSSPRVVHRRHQGGFGKPCTLELGDPPAGLTAIERVLWSELGHAGARAVSWLGRYVIDRHYMSVCESTGVGAHEIQAMRVASPTFLALYEAAERMVRASRVARTEDTLHALANGDVTRTKQAINGATGDIVTLSEQLAPSVEAVKLELVANDPARYSPKPQPGIGGGVSLSIVFGGIPAFLGKPAGAVVDAEIVPPDNKGSPA